jgi:hypothetical protein
MRAPKMMPYRLWTPDSFSLDAGHDPHKEADARLCERTLEVLQRHYAGHQWKIESDARQGILKIQIHALMGDTLHYVILLDNVESVTAFDVAVMKAGGEILERYGLPRGPMELDKFLESRAATPNRPGVKDPIPEGDLRVFDPKPKQELPHDLPEDLRTALEAAREAAE